jgi:hypothetical protein
MIIYVQCVLRSVRNQWFTTITNGYCRVPPNKIHEGDLIWTQTRVEAAWLSGLGTFAPGAASDGGLESNRSTKNSCVCVTIVPSIADCDYCRTDR